MTTAYTLSDTSPKDLGGAKFLAWPNIATSQNDFSLPAGIGASIIGATSKIHSALQVGTHVSASKVSDNAQVGVLPVLAYTANPSSMAIGNAVPLRGSDRGELYISGLSTVTCAMSGSTETFTTSSGLLYKVLVAGTQVSGGASAVILNGGTSIANFIFSSASETLPIFDLGIHGACFSSLRAERRNTVGSIFISMNYSTWGQ